MKGKLKSSQEKTYPVTNDQQPMSQIKLVHMPDEPNALKCESFKNTKPVANKFHSMAEKYHIPGEHDNMKPLAETLLHVMREALLRIK